MLALVAVGAALGAVVWKALPSPQVSGTTIDCDKIVVALKAGGDEKKIGDLRSSLRDCIRSRQVKYYDVANLF